MRGKFGGINKDTWVSIGDMSPIQFDLEVFVFWVGVQYGLVANCHSNHEVKNVDWKDINFEISLTYVHI